MSYYYNQHRSRSETTHQFADPVQHQVDDLFADGVVTSGIVVGGVFLAGDELLRVEKLSVGSCPHLIYRNVTAMGQNVATGDNIWWTSHTPFNHTT